MTKLSITAALSDARTHIATVLYCILRHAILLDDGQDAFRVNDVRNLRAAMSIVRAGYAQSHLHDAAFDQVINTLVDAEFIEIAGRTPHAKDVHTIRLGRRLPWQHDNMLKACKLYEEKATAILLDNGLTNIDPGVRVRQMGRRLGEAVHAVVDATREGARLGRQMDCGMASELDIFAEENVADVAATTVLEIGKARGRDYVSTLYEDDKGKRYVFRQFSDLVRLTIWVKADEDDAES